jgi:predicted phosphodiesterase
VRFAVISNINANLAALEAVLRAIDAQQLPVDRVLSAGDIVGRGPRPNEVVEVLRERGIEAVLGNYDDAVAFDRLSSGRDFPDARSQQEDDAAIAWTRNALTEENLDYLRHLPRDVRLLPGAGGTAVRRNEHDERTSEYRRTFFWRAMLGGAFRMPASATKRVLLVHGSTRALNEIIRPDTAGSILASLAREAQSDVLIFGHAGLGFRRDAHDVTFIGVGPVDGPGSAEYALIDVSREVSVAFDAAEYDTRGYVEDLRRSGLPEGIAALAARNLR